MMLSFGYTKPPNHIHPPTKSSRIWKLPHLFAGSGLFGILLLFGYNMDEGGLAGQMSGSPEVKVKAPNRCNWSNTTEFQLDNKFTAMRGSRNYRPEPLPSAEITVQLRCRMIAPICVVITRDKSCSTRLWKEMFSQLFRNETVHNLVFTYSMVWGRTCYWTGALALSRGHRSQNHSWERLNNLQIHLYAM